MTTKLSLAIGVVAGLVVATGVHFLESRTRVEAQVRRAQGVLSESPITEHHARPRSNRFEIARSRLEVPDAYGELVHVSSNDAGHSLWFRDSTGRWRNVTCDGLVVIDRAATTMTDR